MFNYKQLCDFFLLLFTPEGGFQLNGRGGGGGGRELQPWNPEPVYGIRNYPCSQYSKCSFSVYRGKIQGVQMKVSFLWILYDHFLDKSSTVSLSTLLYVTKIASSIRRAIRENAKTSIINTHLLRIKIH